MDRPPWPLRGPLPAPDPITGPGPARLCVVLHDVAPATWLACREILAFLDSLDLPVTLLAVPRFHGGGRDAAFERWLRGRVEQGDEVALHGYTHLDDHRPPGAGLDYLRRRVYTRGEGEFADLPFAEARRRLQAGLDWLDELGLPPAGFVAPAWLLGAPAWRAVLERDFAYTCTLRHIHLLPEDRRITCQSQVYSTSAAWRRALSIAWNGTLARWQRGAPLVRLELHPGDQRHAAVRRSWQRLAARQARTRAACTLRDLALDLRLDLRTAPASNSP